MEIIKSGLRALWKENPVSAVPVYYLSVFAVGVILKLGH